MAGWESLAFIYQKEKRQRFEEGYDVSKVVDFNQLNPLKQQEIESLMQVFHHCPKQTDYPFVEHNDLDFIMKNAKHIISSFHVPTYQNFYGAMLGRSVGCMLGKPLEVGPYFWESTHEIPGWKNIKKWYALANQYPIRDYVPKHSQASSEGLYVAYETCLKDQIKYVETDDDIRYTLLSLELMENKGITFSSYDIGKLWHNHLPYQLVCTAETQAYLNFAQVTEHLAPGHLPYTNDRADYVRMHHNPYREWIGAQIRIDGYAYVAAGRPLLAAQLAFTDSSFSHVKNGIYGAMFFAALIASAFVEKNIEVCIEQALLVIPKTSRLYQYIKKTIHIVKEEDDLETMMSKVWTYLLDYDPAHTINNACICVASILFSKGDFNRAITTAVLFGLDTDCNGATVGSFMGALLGEQSIESHWRNPLNDTILSMLPNYHPIAITEVSKRFYNLYLKYQIQD
jgi:hypothetical protein